LEGDLAGLSGPGIPIDEHDFAELLVHFIDGAHELRELGLIKQVRLVLLLGGAAKPASATPTRRGFRFGTCCTDGLQDMQMACRCLAATLKAIIPEAPGHRGTDARDRPYV
jgi:hypothetical protein